jgi:hypothetical protein
MDASKAWQLLLKKKKLKIAKYKYKKILLKVWGLT